MIGWPANRRRLGRLSEEFGRRLGGTPPVPLTGSLIGLEHEYLVRRRQDDRRINFAQLVHRIAPSQRGLDPTDRGAYWLPSGTILTADETEAELALPPTATRPGFGDCLVRRVAAAEEWLAPMLGPDFYLGQGVSTHLSVAAPDSLLVRAAETYARSWAPALMLLLDAPDSPGVLIRPRPGRLELCGEFCAADDLRAAALFAVGSVLACLDDVQRLTDRLPRLYLALRMGDQRYGWYVDRLAGGSDLYAAGRRALMKTADGSNRTAQEHLEQAWLVARPFLRRHARPTELALVDRVVAGVDPLRVERTGQQRNDRPAAEGSSAEDAQPTAYGRALPSRRRPGFDLAPVMLTWQLAIFVIVAAQTGRRAFAAIPGRALGRFLVRLERGLLDDAIDTYLAHRPAGRVLADPRQVTRAGLFDAIAIRPALLPAERPVHAPGEAA